MLRLSDLPERLHEFDAVISCTASTLPLIGLGAVERALKKRKHRPMFMVDLAVPRDIEIEVKDLSDVYLYTVDDLAAVVQSGKENRQAAVAQAEAIIDAGVQSFMHWIGQRDPRGGVVELIRDLNAQADNWRTTELRAGAQAARAGEDADAVLEALSRGLTQKMLHGALAELHAGDAAIRHATAQTVSRLFLRGQAGQARMKPFIRATLERQRLRLHELDALLSAPGRDRRHGAFPQAHARACRRRRRGPAPGRHQQRESELAEARAMAQEDDAELAAMAREEIAEAEAELAALRRGRTALLLLPGTRTTAQRLVEIRAGTGGDDRRCSPATWRACTPATPSARAGGSRPSSESPSELGGYKAIVLRVAGQRAMAGCASSPAATGCSACRRPNRRAASTPAPAPSPSCPSPTRPRRSAQPGRPAHRHLPRQRMPAASTSTRPTRRCAWCTCRPASSPNARTAQPAQQQGQGAA